jgi:hypothetical protein
LKSEIGLVLEILDLLAMLRSPCPWVVIPFVVVLSLVSSGRQSRVGLALGALAGGLEASTIRHGPATELERLQPFLAHEQAKPGKEAWDNSCGVSQCLKFRVGRNNRKSIMEFVAPVVLILDLYPRPAAHCYLHV